MANTQIGVMFSVVYRKVQFLDPILFVVYVNDIDRNINNVILKFADDTKLFAVVKDSVSIVIEI